MKEHRKYIQNYLINVSTPQCPTFYSVLIFKTQKTFLIDKELSFSLSIKYISRMQKKNPITFKIKSGGTVWFCNL